MTDATMLSFRSAGWRKEKSLQINRSLLSCQWQIFVKCW